MIGDFDLDNGEDQGGLDWVGWGGMDRVSL